MVPAFAQYIAAAGERQPRYWIMAKTRPIHRCHSGMVRRTRPGISRFSDAQLRIWGSRSRAPGN